MKTEMFESIPDSCYASDDPLEDYTVEKIIDKRIFNAKLQYFIKWKGYSEDHNSWEPEENIDSKLRKDFDDIIRKEQQLNPPPRTAEKILGATDESGTLYFLLKWKGIEEADLIEAKDANVLFPQIVIAFYEERLKWH